LHLLLAITAFILGHSNLDTRENVRIKVTITHCIVIEGGYSAYKYTPHFKAENTTKRLFSTKAELFSLLSSL